MFKFGFSDNIKENYIVNKNEENTVEWFKSEEIVANKDDRILLDIVNKSEINTLIVDDSKIKYLSSKDVLEVLRSNEQVGQVSVINADENHSDLSVGIYEGGLKVWECTYDLVNYISNRKLILNDKRVLDLGCGAGIVGILCLLKGSTCYFQDYNLEVLKYITIPNVKLNAEESLNKCKFYSGDWQSFADLLLNDGYFCENKFNYIFTSETIYNTENYAKLHYGFEKLLSRDGKIFLAAKSYYFGVGGGTALFQDYLMKQNIFDCVTCWECSNGVKREILQIQFR